MMRHVWMTQHRMFQQGTTMALVGTLLLSSCAAAPFLIPVAFEFARNLLQTSSQNYGSKYRDNMNTLVGRLASPYMQNLPPMAGGGPGMPPQPGQPGFPGQPAVQGQPGMPQQQYPGQQAYPGQAGAYDPNNPYGTAGAQNPYGQPASPYGTTPGYAGQPGMPQQQYPGQQAYPGQAGAYDPNNPYGTAGAQNPYGQPASPYGTPSPYGQTTNPYGTQNPYGSQNPYGNSGYQYSARPSEPLWLDQSAIRNTKPLWQHGISASVRLYKSVWDDQSLRGRLSESLWQHHSLWRSLTISTPTSSGESLWDHQSVWRGTVISATARLRSKQSLWSWRNGTGLRPNTARVWASAARIWNPIAVRDSAAATASVWRLWDNWSTSAVRWTALRRGRDLSSFSAI